MAKTISSQAGSAGRFNGYPKGVRSSDRKWETP
nr:MAG TPA: hypothetical protein [Caudoviricetes sp.]